MKPIIILPPHAMSKQDIKALNDNGICVVVAKEPEKVKFVDPIPAASSRNQIENAAIALSKRLLNGQLLEYQRGSITAAFVELLTIGTPLHKTFDDIKLMKNDPEAK